MVNIFIVNWDSANEVEKCLDCIIHSDEGNYRVILINNFSTSQDLNTVQEIYKSYKDIIEIYLIKNNKNLGYAGGNNSGLRFLEKNGFAGDILILNPDIRISPNTISAMAKVMTADIGIVSVRTMDDEGKVLFDSIRLKGFFQKYIITRNKEETTDYAQGSCLMIKRDIIAKIGLFDERFYLYWEEVDFSIRVRKSGWRLVSITTTTVTRLKNRITRQPLAFYYSVRNARLIKQKHPDFFSNCSYILYLLKTFFLTGKFIFKPILFISVIMNTFSGIQDSFNGIYFAKPLNYRTSGSDMTGNSFN